MDKMTSMASCLIRTREYYIGFPSAFTHYPEGMPAKTLESLFEQVQSAMNAPNMIPKNGENLRRIVIGTGKYLVIGISGYARNLVRDDSSDLVSLVDEAKRPSYGFIGFVWDLDKIDKRICGFPTIESFSKLFCELIVSHWHDSNNSKWASQVGKGIMVPYQYEVAFMPLSCKHESTTLNYDKKKMYIFDNDYADSVLEKAINAAFEKRQISVCTDLYLESTGAPFGNLTGSNSSKDVIVTDNAKYTQQAQITQPPAQITQRPDNTGYSVYGVSSEIRTFAHEPEAQQTKNPLAAVWSKIMPKQNKSNVVSGETDIIFVEFMYIPGEEIEKILNSFLSRLKTTYYNRDNKIQIAIELVYCSPPSFVSPLISNIWAVQFSSNVSTSDFIAMCRDILASFCKNRILIPTTDHRYAYQSQQGMNSLRISVSEKYDPAWRLLLNSEEIMRVEREAQQKNKVTRKNNRVPKNTDENEPRTSAPVRIDPSFLRPQKPGSDPEKKANTPNIEDLFKF